MAKLKSHDTPLSRTVPFGLTGQTKPRRYREMFGILWENRKAIPYAWNVLNHGVCDGCSLGPYGLRDDVLDGVHLCMIRLQLLKLNTVPALDMSVLGDVADLRRKTPEQLRSLGHLPYPLIRRRGDRGFSRVSWDDALGAVGKSIHDTAPHQMAFFATPGGLTNEVYYVFQKLARVLGTNNVDLCSRLCHSASDTGLKATLGVGAPTCSLADFIGTDLLILFGTDLANNQPVTTKYMHLAKKAGTQIIVVNPMKEYGLRRYAVPSVLSSVLFGTKWTDDFFQVRVGGDIAFVNGVLKELIESKRIDRAYIDKHTAGFADLKTALERQSWDTLQARSGVPRGQMQRFADLYSQARTAVLVYGMDFTQHEFGVDNVKAVVNLALSRGMLGREKCGIMPIRGDSGVQGGGECGSEPDKFPGGFAVNDDTARRFSNLWHHPVPSTPGLKLPQMIEAAERGEIKFLYSIAGNLYEPMPDPEFVAMALKKVRLRAHQDIVLNTSMLLDAEAAVLLLPSQTRYEQRGGGTSTSTERRIRFTPEIPGHAVGESRPEWEIPVQIGRRSMPNGDKLFPFDDTRSIRDEMSRVIPIYQGIEKLNQEGDQLQWGGPFLFKDGFTGMPNHRALFTVLDPPERSATEGKF
ncbi:MAG: molybdopterin-dependent oxidoreductase [Candidatus Binatia bacterium]